MSERAFLVYHSADLDGKCCGAIARDYFEQSKQSMTVVMLPIDYGQNLLRAVSFHHPVSTQDTLVIMDFSPDNEKVFEALAGVFKAVIWIDHHKSAIEKYAEFAVKCGVTVRLNAKVAACELTWAYFYNEPPPDAVYMLGVYDSWRMSDKTFLWEEEVLPFQYGCRVHNLDPASAAGMSEWELLLLSKGNDDVIIEGKAILSYVTMDNATRARILAFRKEWEGQQCVFLNRFPANSQMFLGVKEETTMMVAFAAVPIKDKVQYRVSLYSEDPKVDVSKIAERYGGGGHRNAAGFICDTLPFLPAEGLQNPLLNHPEGRD